MISSGRIPGRTKPELIQSFHYPGCILHQAFHSDIEVFGVARVSMHRHRIPADNQIADPFGV